MSPVRSAVRTALGYLSAIAGLAILYVLLDFAIDFRPPGIQDSYRFEIGELAEDRPRILRRDNFAIVVIRRSAATVARLRQVETPLQDPLSRDSTQPDYAENALRSRTPEFFVAYAIGTDFGCALEVFESVLKEICGSARYDYAGRALAGKRRFQNLTVPDYNFSDDYRSLTVRP